MNSNQVLDDEIIMEEIEDAIKRIKQGKRAGRDKSVHNVGCMEVSYSRCG